jgi:hypothetical protein
MTTQLNIPGLTIRYDATQLLFTFSPSLNIDKSSTIQEYLGFPVGYGGTVQVSQFPPAKLFGLQAINVWTNFTMNNIPVSEYLCSIPVTQQYGQYIFFTNYNNSMSSLCLDQDINYVRIVLKDDYGEPLTYPDGLDWELVLAIEPTVPEGFAPLEM